ncbi:MAG: DUF7931 domain-containing protein [Betaproteobacteria bacterium]
MSSGAGEAPKTEYAVFNTAGEFRAAVDRLLEQDGRELRLFDPDLASLQMNDPARVERIERFLRASRTRRLFIAVHDPDPLVKRCPRMMSLFARYVHAIQINCTHEEIRSIQDSFLVLDAAHYVRRPVAAHFRGAAGIHDESEALSMRSRFQEIWSASYPGVSATATGL